MYVTHKCSKGLLKKHNFVPVSRRVELVWWQAVRVECVGIHSVRCTYRDWGRFCESSQSETSHDWSDNASRRWPGRRNITISDDHSIHTVETFRQGHDHLIFQSCLFHIYYCYYISCTDFSIILCCVYY